MSRTPALLCALAAVRVFFFAAAFPLVNNVDELAHVDLVFKYSHGYLPHAATDRVSQDAGRLIVLYRSPEYLMQPSPRLAEGFPPPLWRRPELMDSPEFHERLGTWDHPNKEVASFPLYYGIAGAWLAAGRSAGISGGYLLYWVRFLDVIFQAALVCVSYGIVSRLFPRDRLFRIGVPLMVALFPQDAFYSVTSDALTPLAVTLALYALLRLGSDDVGFGLHALAGLSVAAAVLTKISNLYIVLPLAVVAGVKVRRALGRSDRAKQLLQVAVLIAAAVLPVAAWMARNKRVLGDLSGSLGKSVALGWTLKPVGEWLPHPIFTPGGFFYFMRTLTERFWRGEFVWHFQPLRHIEADLLYDVTTAAFLSACLAGLILDRRRETRGERFVIGIGLATCAASVLVLIAASIPFDYGTCWYPSRALPYITSGRLLSGVLVPFLIAYAYGLQRLLAWIGVPTDPLVVLAAIAAAATVSEILLAVPVAGSAFNWFHLVA